jgi:hypothetical protein
MDAVIIPSNASGTKLQLILPRLKSAHTSPWQWAKNVPLFPTISSEHGRPEHGEAENNMACQRLWIGSGSRNSLYMIGRFHERKGKRFVNYFPCKLHPRSLAYHLRDRNAKRTRKLKEGKVPDIESVVKAHRVWVFLHMTLFFRI